MKILTHWLRCYLPVLNVDDIQLAEDLTLRGIAVEGVFELNDASANSDGALFDMDITTNRVDAMNHYGIAREAAAIYNVPLRPLEPAQGGAPPPAEAQPFPVRIEPDAEALCGRFTAQVIRSVSIAPSEGLLAHYFAQLGQKLIWNAVDISNFVLLGIGHPTHAFDLDKIEGGIVVRRAHPGEQLRLLDGSTRTLVSDDLVIADETRAISLAGIMGGFDTMITAETKNILVESAWFAPATIRASSRRHLIHTDASHRFERGADFAAAPIANALVSGHILEACGGKLAGALVDLVIPGHAAATASRPPISLSVKSVQRLLGTTIAPEGITSGLVFQFLSALGCRLETLDAETYTVTLPSWRLDLTREIDLIEEIARVYGYNRFANTLPTPGTVLAHHSAPAEHALRTRLLALGYSETISSSFASAQECAFYAPHAPAVSLENPLSEEAAYLRPTLLPGMVTMLAHNLNRDVLSARLFEYGATFTGSAAAVEELPSLSLGLTGPASASALYDSQDAPFFELKGVLESVLSLLEASAPTFTTRDLPIALHPGRAAAVELDGKVLAHFGQLSAAEASRRKLRQPVYLAEVRVQELWRYPLRQPTARELSRFQAVERDFSFTFADEVEWQAIAAAITALDITELTSLKPVEIFRDAKKFQGHFSILVRTVFQSPDRTLTDAELTGWAASIIGALASLGGVLRS